MIERLRTAAGLCGRVAVTLHVDGVR